MSFIDVFCVFYWVNYMHPLKIFICFVMEQNEQNLYTTGLLELFYVSIKRMRQNLQAFIYDAKENAKCFYHDFFC